MIEQDAVADEEIIGLAIIYREPVPGQLTDPIGAAGIEGCLFILRWRRRSEHFRRACLVVAYRAAAMGDMVAQCFYQTQGAHCDDIGGVFGHLERDPDMALGAEVVYLIRFNA